MVPCIFNRHTLKLYKGPDLDRDMGNLGLVSWVFWVKCGRDTIFWGIFCFSVLYYRHLMQEMPLPCYNEP